MQSRRLSLLVHPSAVFVPNLMSWYSAAQMHVFRGETFCDVGVGSGLHAILAAKMGARKVFGTDINPVALRFARENARRNGVAGVCTFLHGSLTAPLKSRGIRVDAVVCNAPQFPGKDVQGSLPGRLKASVDGGPSGGELNARFLREAKDVLLLGGRVYNPAVSWANPSATFEAIADSRFRSHELSRRNIPEWGRGNRTREWLLDRPGRHAFRYEHGRGRDSLARICELRQDSLSPVTPPKPIRAEISFHS